MIRFDFISIHPRFLDAYFEFGIFSAAQKNGIANFTTVNLRNFAVDRHGSVDDRPYGGGDGMILRPEPLRDAVLSCHGDRHVVFTSPGGELFNHEHAVTLAKIPKRLVFVCGRFGGVDQRFIDQYVDQTFSLGRFVASGGELPCLMIADAVLRQVPGVLGNHKSAQMDSFADGLAGAMEEPQYTRPESFEGIKVPDALKSGNHQEIAKWRNMQQRRQKP